MKKITFDILLNDIEKRKINPNTHNFTANQESIHLPIASGRSSEPDNNSGGFSNKNAPLLPDFPIEWLNTLENLAIFNRHVSYALDNIMTLSNTEYTIDFSDSVPSALKIKMKEHLKKRIGQMYGFSSGENSLINDLLMQAGINGALSFDILPQQNLKVLKKISKVSPKYF